jgi:hypothetical protein
MVDKNLPQEISEQLAKLKKGQKMGCGQDPDDYPDRSAPTRLFCPWHKDEFGSSYYQGERDTFGRKDGRGIIIDPIEKYLSIMRFAFG